MSWLCGAPVLLAAAGGAKAGSAVVRSACLLSLLVVVDVLVTMGPKIESAL